MTDRQGERIFQGVDPEEALSDYLRAHQSLRKEESSVLTQVRTGRIGLRRFLFLRRVPGVATPYCVCGEEEETAEHLLDGC